jgi:hypothetical protein
MDAIPLGSTRRFGHQGSARECDPDGLPGVEIRCRGPSRARGRKVRRRVRLTEAGRRGEKAPAKAPGRSGCWASGTS